MTRWSRIVVGALTAVVLLQSGAGAQSLAYSVFAQYLESLRVQASIPGLSAVIVQDGRVAAAIGLGFRDVEAAHAVSPDTPYPLADLTQPLSATLLMQCVERGELLLGQSIGEFLSRDESPTTTVRQLLTHTNTSSASGFRYDPARFGVLATVAEACWQLPFRKVLAQEIFDRSVMQDAVPGYDIASTPAEVRDYFDGNDLARYAATLRRMATPYRVDRRGRATRSDLPPAGVNASHGAIASALDLAYFDIDLDWKQSHLRRATLNDSWTNATHNGATIPTGLGWFVQTYQGEKLVWAFGHSPDAFSSLILKIPARRLTLILLANSDGLTAPYALGDGDVTSSIFARTFLRLFL